MHGNAKNDKMINVQNTAIIREEKECRVSFFRMIVNYCNPLQISDILFKFYKTKNQTKLKTIPSIWITNKVLINPNLLEKVDSFYRYKLNIIFLKVN